MRRLLFALALAGCAAYVPTGPAPKVAAPRAASLQVDVTGTDKAELEAYVAWILKDNGLLRRVSSGGDLHVAVEANLDRSVHILAGTDLKLTVRVRGDNLDDSRTWERTGLTNGVPTERDKLLTEAVVWALGRAATSGTSSAVTPAPAPAPVESRIEAPAGDTPEPAATAPSTSHKKKHRR
jgi:hypothetical protein